VTSGSKFPLSHSLTVPSDELVAILVPSRTNAKSITSPRFPEMEPSSRPVRGSHKRTLPLKSPVTKRLPSGLNATALTSGC